MATGVASPTDGETTPHNAVIHNANHLLTLILEDPFLSYLSRDCSVEDAKSQLALVQGKAITIHIKKFDGEVISVIVLQGASVLQLMQAFQRKVEKQCDREGRTKHLSWRYVWKNYWLVCGQTLLENSREKLVSYGVSNQATLHFTRKLKKKL